MTKPIVWVEGLIAAGKSSIVQRLEALLGFRTFPEPVADKGYLELFYQDPERWAFAFQVEMLKRRWDLHRLAMLEARCGTSKGCLLDRGMPGDWVFANMHYRHGTMHELEWQTYKSLYDEFMSVPHLQPTILVFLDVDPEVALERLRKRNRSGETVTLDYLLDLRSAYDLLLAQLGKGQHPWAIGMQILRVPWSKDDLPIETIARQIRLTRQQQHNQVLVSIPEN